MVRAARDLITSHGDASTLVSAITWAVLGASGVLGAVGGDLVRRSWAAPLRPLARGTAGTR